LNGKEKFKAAISHQEAPLLIDIGGLPTTGIHCLVVEGLREYYGLEKRLITIAEPMQLLGVMDDDLKEVMGIQTSSLWAAGTCYGFRQTNEFKEWRTPWGQEVLVAKDFVTTSDNRNYTYIYAEGDTSFEPAACLPESGFFFDSVSRTCDFDEDNYDVRDNLEEFKPISEEDLEWLKRERTRLENSKNLIMGSFGGTAIGDVSMVPGPMLKAPRGIRDITDWYMSIIERPEVLHEIFDYQVYQGIQNLKKIHDVVGESIQVVFICGTDFGTQNAPFCSNETFRDLYLPHYKKLNNWIHENTTWKTFKHSCGSILPLVPELIEAGFDILNPVQWTAEKMNREELKKKYGSQVVFWGGGVDTQGTLPKGTPKQVYEEVLECCEIFSEGGGFVFNTIHNIQPDVPVENVVAMVEAVRKFNGE
jgi:hypothetical protein